VNEVTGEEGRVRRCFVPPRNTSWCLVEGSGGGREDPNFLVFNQGLCMLFNSGCLGDVQQNNDVL
jgi:hypothetical protein